MNKENKEKLVSYLNKHKFSIIFGALFLVASCFIYDKAHTNTPDDINDHTGKYILNPDYTEFNKYDWTDLKTVYPTKLAYDPNWFTLPPDKYIPKEQPIPRSISSISDPIIRRQAYFNFLCKSEYSDYMTNDIKNKTLDRLNADKEGVLDLTVYRFFPKTKSTIINIDIIDSNPFILPVYNHDYIPLKEGDTYNLFWAKINSKPYGNI
jgi:hypothetical protein